jgi:mRNA-degrading endonuclease RelE of RelBE toxin-antitoxin system
VYVIDVAPKAERQLKKIFRKEREVYLNIKQGIQSLQGWPNVSDVKKLTGHAYGHRLRVRDYRVFFNVEKSVRVIKVEEVRRRDEHTY